MNASDTGHAADDQIDQIAPEAADHDHQQQQSQAQDQQPAQDQRQADGQPQPGYPPRYDYRAGDEPLSRPVHDRMIAGVAAGIARYLGVDVTVVRIVLAVLTVVGGAGVPVYIAGWLLIPEEGAQQSIASELVGSLQGRSS